MTVDLPCYPEVRQWLLRDGKDSYLVNDGSATGKVVLEMLEGKRSRIASERVRSHFPARVQISMSHSMAMNIGSRLRPSAVHAVNSFVRQCMYDSLFQFLKNQLMMNPAYSITGGIILWMEMNRIDEEAKSVDSLKRTFLNWRNRNCPELVRPKGRPTKNNSWNLSL